MEFKNKRKDARNRKITWNMFVLCFCYIMSSVPHTIYGYWGTEYDKQGDQIYRISLGLFWLQYAFNVWIYVAQRDQYWSAYKDYIYDHLVPTKAYKIKTEENNQNKFDSSTSEKANNLNVDDQSNGSQSIESSLHNQNKSAPIFEPQPV